MYLQITTKCNMYCLHCCYSCGKHGKHADWETVVDMVAFAREHTEIITIGGGEPTLHPRFFDILKICLQDFDYVWMATNGSQTATMWRLVNIMNDNDYPEGSCDEEDEDYDYRARNDCITSEGKLSVALSQDPWHDPIDARIVAYWEKRAKDGWGKHTNFEIRDVSKSRGGAIRTGRAKRTGEGWGEQCVCGDLIVKPDGKVRMCGCEKSPIIGSIRNGISKTWEAWMSENEKYQDTRCYFGK